MPRARCTAPRRGRSTRGCRRTRRSAPASSTASPTTSSASPGVARCLCASTSSARRPDPQADPARARRRSDALPDQLGRLPCDGELLVGRHDGDDDRRRVGRDDARLVRAGPVASPVDRDAEPLQAVGDGRAQGDAVLTDAGGEDEDVDAAEDREVGTDVVLEPVHDDVEGQTRIGVTRGQPVLELAEVVDPAEPEHTGPLVEEGVDLLEREPGLAAEVGVQTGVDVAGPGPHDEALQRRQAHRRLDRDAAADGRGGAAVAQVQDHLAQLADGAVEQVGGRAGDPPVRRAVEAVATDRVAFREITGQRICRRLRRQRREEGRVEDGDVRHVEVLACRFDAGHGGRVVQWGKGAQLAHPVEDRVVDDDGLGEVGASVHDPVADGAQARCGEVDAVGAEVIRHPREGSGVVGDAAAGFADALDGAAGLLLTGLGHDELVLQRRRPGVEHEDGSGGVGHARSCCWAWTAVMATVLTMSSTSAPRERSLTGLRRPCRTGPIATAWALRWTALYVLLPVLRSGKTNTVAWPATSEPGSLARPTAGSIAASYWIGPARARSGARSPTSSVAARTFSTSAPEPLEPVE